MANNIFNRLKPEARLSKNGFDLSHRTVFSCKAGQLIPCLSLPVVPGDHFKMDASALHRTQTLNTAAFARLKVFYHYYFVSNQSLWHNWDTFISQRENYETSYHKGSAFAPTFDLDAFLKEQANLLDINDQPAMGYDAFGYNAIYDRFRLLDMLGYGKYLVFDQSAGKYIVKQPKSGFYPSVFPILAYNKIYYDYYANPYYEGVLPLAFNVDDIDCSTAAGSRLPLGRFTDLLYMKYRNWKKDYFTGLFPSQQFGDVSVAPLTPNVLQLKATNMNGSSIGTLGAGSDGTAHFYPPNSLTYQMAPTIVNGVSVLDIRRAEALQRWKETTMRAGFRHQDQQKAHFGIEPRNYQDNHAKFIGGFDDTIAINEVVATASSGNSENDVSTLGQIAGKGVGAMNSNSIEYDVTEFGTIMCIMSIVPEADYQSIGLSRELTFTNPFDWFTPELQNLGLDGVYQYELNANIPKEYSTKTLGYGYRYLNYKTAVDKVHGEFCSDGTMSAWVTPRVQGLNSAYSGGINVSFLKINPACLDPIFAYMGSALGPQEFPKEKYDQFLINLYHNISAIRPMSELGLPY